MDVDATAVFNGLQFNGDAGWYAAGMSPEECAEVYLQQIQAQLGGSSFNPGKPWMTFAGQTNPTAWNDRRNGETLRIARFGNKWMITAGATTGIVYSAVDAGAFNPGWRHLCNTCYTTLSDWNADRRA